MHVQPTAPIGAPSSPSVGDALSPSDQYRLSDMYRILAGVTEAAAASVYGIAEDHSRVFATWSRDLEGQAERLARSADIGGADARRAEQ